MQVVTYTSRAAWLEARRSYLGGSDAPAVLEVPGRPKWCQPWIVWAEKVHGPADEEDEEVAERIEAGNRLEHANGQWAADRAGLRIVDGGGKHWIPGEPRWLACTPDFVVEHPEREGRGVLQVKNVAEGALGSSWEDRVPLYVEVQVQHELAATGLGWGYAAALIGGNRLRVWPVERNDEFIDTVLLPRLEDWWSLYVESRVEPDFDDVSVVSPRDMARLFPDAYGSVVELGSDAAEKLDRWDELVEQIEPLRASLDAVQNWFRLRIGKARADVGRVELRGEDVTWKQRKDGSRVLLRRRMR